LPQPPRGAQQVTSATRTSGPAKTGRAWSIATA
jgi:hypothetical protein